MAVRILARHQVRVSSWVELVSKEVEWAPGQQPETYHCFSQPDYVAILARTRSGLIPIVRQYRPAVEAYTWELPAGLVEKGEDPEVACRRELKEETGLEAESVTYLGGYYADTGRLANRLHAFFVQASDPPTDFMPELHLSVEFVTLERLETYIRSGKFQHQLHLGLLALAPLRGVGKSVHIG